jgi:drug/metabolite transporter (DMT)-like permease
MQNKIPGVQLDQGVLVGVVFALFAAVGFSAKAILVKLAYLEHVDAITLLALRMVFSVPFFIGIALWARIHHAVPLGKLDKLLVLALGLIGYYLSSFLDFLGLQYITAGLERLILFLYPTMTVILAALVAAATRYWRSQPPAGTAACCQTRTMRLRTLFLGSIKSALGPKIVAAMALSYAGIALVFLHDVGVKQGGSVVLGGTLVFLSTLSYSTYLVGAGHAIARIGTARFTAYAMIVASAASLLQFFLMRPMNALDLSLRVYELSIAMAIFSTVLPVFLLSYAIKRIGSGSASLIGSIGPVSTIVMAYLFLGEGISALQIIGSSLVLIGVVIISLNSRKI